MFTCIESKEYIIFVSTTTQNTNTMTTQITITLNGKKSGQLIYFTLEMLKSNFFKVIDMEFQTVDQLLEAEKTGLFKIV